MRPPLPPEVEGKPFPIGADGAPGVSRSRGRARDLVAPFRGIRMPAAESGIRALCAAYAVAMPPGHFFSHSTAATLHGLPVVLEPRLHVSSMEGAREPRARGIVGHRVALGSVHVVEVAGVRAASAVDAWLALAASESLERLVMVGDALVRRAGPNATLAELRDAVDRAAGKRGARRIRAALALVRARTDSPRETRVRLWLVWAGLPEPEVNVAILDGGGRFIALGDLVYRRWRVLVEYDGGHHFTPDQAIHDIDRLEAVMAAGWRVVRINKTHSQRAVVALVRAALTQAGAMP